MKILHIYSGNLFGGIETLLVTLAKEQSLCMQMQHHFALCFEGRLAHELRSFGAKIHSLGKVRISHPWTMWQARLQLQQLLKQERFDLVICHSCWSQAIFGSVVRAKCIPLIFWCHDVPNGKHPLEQWAKKIPPNLVIANSLYTQAAVSNLYPQIDSKILLCPVACPDIGKDASIRQDVRAELNTPDDAIVLIQVSRLERWKGQSFLLSALGNLRDIPGWICWLVGGIQRSHEAEYLQELKIQAQQLGIEDRVLFLGQRTDVPRLLAAADIHCQPNTGGEPFGIAFVEALYAGLPVVTTTIGAGMEIVDDSCGRLVAPNDINALSDVLNFLILNPSERATLAAGGKPRAEYLCNPAQQLTRLYNLLSEVVEYEAVA
ncbi:glycosyltransferase family 4 protein [Anabaena azotica]|uniref:Glycosyltransferase family 4 protein n=1 Tax=Anabaena azotica FACHB-119 TaxID=947527 RepID=A0ABR8D9P0_9NOST|nr:glycosyltransferase family 4 protein [Anabaena azotica]MBD2503652.1 glycosyltransferase family 4 protein [Anabaena azotica FACHB-119]